MKQTAVEWLVNEFIKKGLPIEKYGMDLYEQAQQMEKQQIIDAYINGGHQHRFKAEAEQYYNNIFKNKEQ
jgi:hypothetical protein